jgi:tRNA (cmo5U34)-methyltransferase
VRTCLRTTSCKTPSRRRPLVSTPSGVLELGVGTGQTSKRVLDLHPEAELVGIDESAEMLATASMDAFADLRVSRLQNPLPEGNFDLVVSALTVHHLDSAGKTDLFARDVVVPDDPADAVTPIDGVYDQPSTVDDQVRWLAAVGLQAEVVWARQDLAVIIADSPP